MNSDGDYMMSATSFKVCLSFTHGLLEVYLLWTFVFFSPRLSLVQILLFCP